MNELNVLTMGEAMAMFIADEPGSLEDCLRYERYVAGAETNVAIGLSRLGIRTAWMSKVGDDSFGRMILKTLTNEGVDVSHVLVDALNPTGFQLKSKVDKGDPVVEYFRKNSSASKISLEDFPLERLPITQHLHLTGIPPAISSSFRELSWQVLNHMKQTGVTISFDPNLRPSLWSNEREMISVINRFAEEADWMLPGMQEGEILTGYRNKEDIASYYLERGVKLVVIKLGEEGAYFATENERKEVPGFAVTKVVDTVGAGDGFAVGVISALLEGSSYEDAVVRGNAIGAKAVMSSGDHEGLPNREELEHFMKKGVLQS
ncbi:sugar kinase [Peribacillus sp. NPDC060253]|uniref:sugar kinase n=1 Tax=Peribacillus sp. NPDC060253 TaxID=3347084 RepID=UPI00366270AE